MKYLLLAIGGLVVVVGALVATKASQIGSMMKAGESFAPPPESVTTAKVERTKWEPVLNTVGSLVAMRTVTIASELPGKVQRLGFESGTAVKAGQLLVQLDSSIEQAQLASAAAEASLNTINKKRAASLRELKANTQAELDVAEARALQSDASVANMQAMIAKKSIRAPFDGRLGIRTVEVGQVLAPGTPIVTLTAFDPIYADFSLPQQALSQVAMDQVVRLDTDTFPGESWEGKITAINPEVDVATRSMKARAQFTNTGEKLRPGMFVNVHVVLPEKKTVLIVPATAIIHAPYGDSVFVIEEQNAAKESTPPKTVVRQKFVRLGERRGDLVTVDSGLEGDETVVSSGSFKLKNGSAVIVDNTLAPDSKVAPNPDDT